MYTEDAVMPFGKYEMWPLKHVPNSYLINLWVSNNKSIKERDEKLYAWMEQNIAPLTIKPPKEQFVPFICKKETYATEADARFRLKTIRSRNTKSSKIPIRIYECPDCSGWHLTSKEDRRFRPA